MTTSFKIVLAACGLLMSGCSLVQTQAVPVQRVPHWMRGEPRANREPINMLSLRADPPEVYQLGPRDILGVYIPGILGTEEHQPPTHFAERSSEAPAFGFPIPIRDDGSLVLPFIPPVKIAGMTLSQAEKKVLDLYVDNEILVGKRTLVMLTLMRKRTNQILVVREDSGAAPTGGMLLVGPSKRGSVFSIDLPSDESDVMHALAQSGGLPGLDAQNEVIVFRGKFTDARQRECLLNEFSAVEEYLDPNSLMKTDKNIVRIPLRAGPGMPEPKWTEDDIRLQTGDVVFIETREREVFYTGGTLPGREIILPRDYDLDVLAAISLAGGSAATGVTASANAGMGGGGGGGGAGGIIPATQIIVVRRLPNGSTVPIRINLNRAIVNAHDRILIQPGDLVLLQYTPAELAGNIVLGTLSFNYFLNKIN